MAAVCSADSYFESEGYPFDITIAQDKKREFFSCEMVDLYLQVFIEGFFDLFNMYFRPDFGD